VQGDALLNMLGHLLRGCTRRGVDLAARYGGDEFVVVLPDTPVFARSPLTAWRPSSHPIMSMYAVPDLRKGVRLPSMTATLLRS